MLVLKDDYKPTLSMRDTQKAIKIVRDTFEDNLALRLNLERISAPLFVTRKSGINDDLNGVERAVSFDVKEMPEAGDVVIVHSLAKWKRLALKKYGFDVHKGYGTKAHCEAILANGACSIHRTSFLKKLYGQK